MIASFSCLTSRRLASRHSLPREILFALLGRHRLARIAPYMRKGADRRRVVAWRRSDAAHTRTGPNFGGSLCFYRSREALITLFSSLATELAAEKIRGFLSITASRILHDYRPHIFFILSTPCHISPPGSPLAHRVTSANS